MATAMDDQFDEETDDDQQLSEQATVSAKHMARLANLKVDRYRLVGNDNLLVKACVYKTAKLKAVTVEWPIVVPESMIPTILSLFHGDKAIIAHGGKHKTYGAMRKRFVWKGMVQSIRQWIGACHKCLIRKRQVPQHQRYNVHPKAVAPMNRICIDIVGPLVESSKGNNHILTIYDPFSHWPAAYAIPKTDSKTIVNCLKHHIALHSVPGKVLSDRGRNLMSAEVRDFLHNLGAKKFETSSYKPSSNGSVERFHRYLNAAISQAIDGMESSGQKAWDEHLDSALFAYRVMPIEGLDVSPFEVIYGRNPNLPIDNILFRENYDKPVETLQEYLDMMFENQTNMFGAIERNRAEQFERNKRNSTSQAKPREFKIGEKIYLNYPKGRWSPIGGSTKLSPVHDGPFTVLERLCDGLVYRVQHDILKNEYRASYDSSRTDGNTRQCSGLTR